MIELIGLLGCEYVLISLIHDDVIDEADTRRGVSSVHSIFNKKVAVLAGDYLFARACMQLARLGDPRILEAMTQALSCLVSGEILQATHPSGEQFRFREGFAFDAASLMKTYMLKTYYKTSSLFRYSCRACSILAGCGNDDDDDGLGNRSKRKQGLALGERSGSMTDAEKFGFHLGLAYQIVDDILDLTGSSKLGKPVLADLSRGMFVCLCDWTTH